jgi:hypothetical protein
VPGSDEVSPQVLLTRDLERAELDRLLTGGVVHRLRRGAYTERLPTQGRSRDARHATLARIRAVAAQTRLDAWFSHTSAAVVWGCPVLHLAGDVHVIQRSHPGQRKDDCLVRHVGVLDAADRAVVDGLRVTGLARTLIDCASVLPERDGLVGWEMHRAGLPAPDLQVPVRTRRCWRYVDLGWPAQRVGLEFDGRIKYTGEVGVGGVPALLAEKERQEELEEEGWRLVRASWRDVHTEGAALALRVRRALAGR